MAHPPTPSMLVPKHSPSTQPNAIAWLRALLVFSLGYLLMHALAPVSADVAQSQVRVEAELRVGAQPPAPVAEVGTGEASLYALTTRIRTGAQPLLTAATPVSVQLPLHLRRHAQQAPSPRTRAPVRGVTRWHWLLPRSSCHADDEPSSAQAIQRS